MRKKHNGVHKESTNAPTYRSKLILVTRNIDYLILGIFKRDVGKKRPKAWWFVRVRYTENDSVFDIPIKEWEAGRRPKKYKNNRYFIMEQSRSKGYVVLDAKFGYRPDGTEQEQKNAIREWWVLVKDREFLTNIWKRYKGISRGVKLISLDEEASVIVNEASNKYPNDYICSSAIHGHKRYPGSWSVVIQHRFTQTCFLYPLSEWRRGKLPIIPIGFEKEVTIDPDYSFMGIVSLGTKGKPLKCAWEYCTSIGEKVRYESTYKKYIKGHRHIRNNHSLARMRQIEQGLVKDGGPTIVAVCNIAIRSHRTVNVGKVRRRHELPANADIEHRYNTKGAYVLSIEGFVEFDSELEALKVEHQLLVSTQEYRDKETPTDFSGCSETRKGISSDSLLEMLRMLSGQCASN